MKPNIIFELAESYTIEKEEELKHFDCPTAFYFREGIITLLKKGLKIRSLKKREIFRAWLVAVHILM